MDIEPKQGDGAALSSVRPAPPSDDRADLLNELHSLPGSEIVDRILSSEGPRELVESLPSGDFYWLIKKVGLDDCLPVLRLASEGQWQYLFDLEVWKRDRLDLEKISDWLGKLQEADPKRLVKWLVSEAQALAFYHVFNNVEVIILEPDDEALDIPEGFISFDGMLYIRARNPKYREQTEALIRNMADQDFERYQALLQNLPGLVPAETEESMYRMRRVRMAEHGFLPFEEALSAYAPLDPKELGGEQKSDLPAAIEDSEIKDLVPVSPLHQSGMVNLFTETVQGMEDRLLLDRARQEFAGLCNQIIVADGIEVDEIDDLLRISRKVCSHLNLGLERTSGRDRDKSEELLRQHSLLSVYRVGIGLCLKVKWEAERWMKGSWYHGQGLTVSFWGEAWGGLLSGLLMRIPVRYTGYQAGYREGVEYRDFEWISQLSEALEELRRMMVLDSLLEQVEKRFPMDEDMLRSPEMTFRPLLFNLWGRLMLNLAPGIRGISPDQAEALFDMLRGPAKEPPYDMSPFEGKFINDFSQYATMPDPDTLAYLGETLSGVWQGFSDEYAWVIDPKGSYSKYVTIVS